MKTILVPTDFSQAAENAAYYALKLAQNIKAHIKLCNAFKVAMETPVAAQVVWPMEDYDELKTDINGELKILADRLERQSQADGESFKPRIDYTCEVGTVTDVVRNIVDEEDIGMIVMGMSGAGFFSRLFLGSTSRDMIDKVECPVLLVPLGTTFKPVTKIGFATDLNSGDIDVIHSLAGLAKYMNAEILVAHIADEKFTSEAHQHKIDRFLTDVTCKANYSKIYYRSIKSMDVEHGLDWLAEHGQLDMLVMVHHWHHFFNRLIAGSHTKKIAGHIHLPLLVYSGHDGHTSLPVF
jgi:nucleotide-binding universal stress UspA family protein